MNEGIALRYGSLGWGVFPLAARSKIPQIPKKDGGRGCHDATTDTGQIEAWWLKWPSANVGIATGPVSSIWVLDVDPNTSPEGAAWLAEMEAENGPLPDTPEARTLKSGRHLVFRWNDQYPVGNRVNFKAGLDARGDGGYIVAAPSFVSERKHGRLWEGKYEWLDDKRPSVLPVADAPIWLLESVIHKAQSQTQEEYVPRERREGDGFKYGHKALDAECQEIMGASPGGQDNQIVSSAFKIGQLVAGGEIPRQDAEDALVNAAMAIPGQSKPLEVIVDKINRALKAGGEKPRQAPPPKFRPRVVAGTAALPSHDPETGEILEDDNSELEPETEKPGNWTDHSKWAMGLNWSLTEKGGLKPSSMNNLTLMFEHHPGLREKLALNRFSYEVWIRDGLPSDDGEEPDRELQDNDEVAVAGWLNTLGLTPGVQSVGQVMRLVASRASFDPVEDYLSNLKWDGKRRIDKWLTKYAGAEGNEYAALVGPKFLISAVARVLQPGCKVDTMLVLEGPQGLKKSTLARALFGSEWFSDQVGDITSKEASIQIQGLWCVEVAEMDAFNRAVEQSAAKAFITRQEDRYRPPYGRSSIKRPRRCVFIGTINPEGSGWLRDSTGGRRYWPVAVSEIDIIGIGNDRDQLWAEAVSRFRAGETWWLEASEERIAIHEQSARQTEDLWDKKIREFLDSKYDDEYFTNSDVAEALGLTIKDRDFRVERRVGAILTRMKCKPAKPRGDDGAQYRAWKKPKEDE